ncbi:oligosaccharide flippase family protein [Polyangium aurulentum]|uniref:oligosaccharide flippase family protein n=1 Tax=Polyangium aurulentum TaxID=2567896 RepID=UPI00146EB852|nr:oligosaccharide flippase family protein [Polyangium aurulentum]UQA56632.1 flippase [Polyangium aurulentum]
MHQGQRVALNAALMLAKQAIMAVLSVVFVGYLARSVGVASWGEFQASLAIAATATVVAGLGVRGYLAREIAVNPELGPRHLGSALIVRGVTSTVMLGAVVVVTLFTRSGTGERLVIIAAISQLATQLYTTMWLSFEAHERFQYILYVELGARLFVIATASASVALGLGIEAAAGAFALGNVIELGLTYHFLRTSLYRPKFEAKARELFSILKKSLPIGLIGALIGLLHQLDRVMLRWLGDENAVGIFSAAWVLVEQLEMISDLVFGAAFAAAMRLYAHDRKGFGELYRMSTVVAAALGLPIAAGASLLAPDIIKLVYGGRGFDAAGSVLILLAWHVPATFAFQVAAMPLLAQKREGALAKILVPAVLANIVLDVLLVPRYRAFGAAGATLAVGMGVLVVSGLVTNEWARTAPLKRLLSCALSTAAMTAAAAYARQLGGMWAAIAVGAVVHGTLLLALRAITIDELRSLLRRPKKPTPPRATPEPPTATPESTGEVTPA